MAKSQFAQKIEPELNEQLDELIKQYTQEGRIKDKGDIVSMMYKDHLELEQKRQSKNMLNGLEEVESLLRRIEELFIQGEKGYISKLGMQIKKQQEQNELHMKNEEEKNKVITLLKDQLNEKTIQLYEANKELKKSQTKLKALEEKFKRTN